MSTPSRCCSTCPRNLAETQRSQMGPRRFCSRRSSANWVTVASSARLRYLFAVGQLRSMSTRLGYCDARV
jgi:hypothetical protein